MEVSPAEGAGAVPTGATQERAGRSGEKASAGERDPGGPKPEEELGDPGGPAPQRGSGSWGAQLLEGVQGPGGPSSLEGLSDVEAWLVLQGSQWAYLPPERDRGPAPATAPRPGGRESGGTPRVSRWALAPAPIEPEPPPPTPTQEDERICRWLESQRPPTPRRRVRPSGWDVPPKPRGPTEVWKCTPSSPDAGDDPTTTEDVDSDSDGEDLFEQLDPESQVPGAIQASVDSMMEKMVMLFPSEMRAERRVRARTALEESFKRANEEYTLESAVKAAGNFEFDKEALARDLREFEACEGNLEKMIRERRRQRSGSRLSARRVHECISADNPEPGGRCPSLAPVVCAPVASTSGAAFGASGGATLHGARIQPNISDDGFRHEVVVVTTTS
ncbi:hypothetical protein B484DRAFT_406383 [Ochromonadaceae sp. CCMP2298]|nr:hypothetical protein B484DRAFT_406383 [Ochromonadaceae sp. CCMP2298]